MTPHEHADILRAIAAGEAIEGRADGFWVALSPQNVLLWLGHGSCELRIKPKPRQPREWWVNVYAAEGHDYAHRTKEEAEGRGGLARLECVHVREVLPDAEAKSLLDWMSQFPTMKPEGARCAGLWIPEALEKQLIAYLERQI